MTCFLNLPDDIMFLLFEKYFDRQTALNLCLVEPSLLQFYDNEKTFSIQTVYEDKLSKTMINEYFQTVKGSRLDLSSPPFKSICNFVNSIPFNIIATMTNLKVLAINLIYRDVTGLDQLSKLSMIEYLKISIRNDNDIVNLGFINKMPEIKYLFLYFDCKISFPSIDNLKKLKCIYYSSHRHNTNKGLFSTLNSNSIEILKIDVQRNNHEISDEDIDHISSFALKTFILKTNISTNMLISISSIVSLEYLILMTESIYICMSDVSHAIEKMSSLKSFELYGNMIYGSNILVVKNQCLEYLVVKVSPKIFICGLDKTLISSITVNEIDKSFLDHPLNHLKFIFLNFSRFTNCDTMNLMNAPGLNHLTIKSFYESNGIDFLKKIPADAYVSISTSEILSDNTMVFLCLNKKRIFLSVNY